ncbi:hypothetical protein SERLADRAFT_406875 [Serpula lacrymans var. lacrymans S7.9]|uniref:Uncharacterized protein n=1 Tax=Serpula lacrymans var. lacrymans (strain S7.9) TaxID=578457 RepID=F8NN43_SERL9|nr:uncharacterized protein SERLADRAFT_406875 [Serpula lacrymans var. lacrymans S7.9]EGO27964.1 hypothetical protein SERLADRAFT_406875 [Serpula lacrymans var. lacrymans S7.9]
MQFSRVERLMGKEVQLQRALRSGRKWMVYGRLHQTRYTLISLHMLRKAVSHEQDRTSVLMAAESRGHTKVGMQLCGPLPAGLKSNPSNFVSSTHGSHHIHFVDQIARLWNFLAGKKATRKDGQILNLWPVLLLVNSGKNFGLVPSNNATMFGGFLDVKIEGADKLNGHEPHGSLEQALDYNNEIKPATVLQDLDIDPMLLLIPQDSYHVHGPSQKSGKRKAIEFVTAEGNTQASSSTSAPSTSQATPDNNPGKKTLASFFNMHGSKDKDAIKEKRDREHTESGVMSTKANSLFQPVPPHNMPSISHSQRIFSIFTGIDPRSLVILTDREFYLFMDMRYQHKWVSFSMSAQKWVDATEMYNVALEELCTREGIDIVRKNPRALFDKLGDVETAIIERMSTNNYIFYTGD